MKKLVIILMFLATSAYGRGGPKYAHNELSPKLDDEISNIYEDMAQNLYNGGRISSGTILNLTVSTLTYTTLSPSLKTITNWTSYTPTTSGLGTPVSVSYWWKQIGDTIYVRGLFALGTPTGAAITISLPNSTVIDTSKISSGAHSYLGTGRLVLNTAGPTTQTTSHMPNVFFDVVSSSVVFLAIQTGSQNFTKLVGTSLGVANDVLELEFSYPISGS